MIKAIIKSANFDNSYDSMSIGRINVELQCDATNENVKFLEEIMKKQNNSIYPAFVYVYDKEFKYEKEFLEFMKEKYPEKLI